ncbi:MAG: hypothetical protein RBS78_03015 [Coriobacteriia bacterium]|jgi:hypothetical protein|nr:hypothetical protein [Coriobacteriia bacterium]
MPQYGMIVFSQAPADPLGMDAEHLAALADYPEQVRALKGKILGGSYFAKQRGFAFAPSTLAVTVRRDEMQPGTLTDSGLVASAFYVLAAPSIEIASQIAALHPAARDGAVEIHPIFKPADLIENDYDD